MSATAGGAVVGQHACGEYKGLIEAQNKRPEAVFFRDTAAGNRVKIEGLFFLRLSDETGTGS